MASKKTLKSFYKTPLGEMLHGDAKTLLHSHLEASSVDLIMTSPPFPLLKKKSYGNESSDEYCEWFRPFAEGFQRVLKDSGSLVIDLGGVWEKGMPVRSLYQFELLIMLCKEFGFHLAQEHYWWNPGKMPSPAEWVNIRRIRVKDAVNTIWWLSKTPWPKADNKRVLAPYSKSMKKLLKNGYQGEDGGTIRPSEWKISEVWGREHAGSIPPNLLAISNTSSTDKYLRYCEENGIQKHTARFPSTLPEYFIRFLTDQSDLVVDPFAGSCVTGEVAQELGRRWICSELEKDYLKGAVGRFVSENPSAEFPDLFGHDGSQKKAFVWEKDAHSIPPPCAISLSDEERLDPHGGRKIKK